MFTLIRIMVRFYVLGLVTGVLLAPRAGADTRRMLSERLESFVRQVSELATAPVVEPARARTDGHLDRPTPKRRAKSNARASS